jgi:thermitase
MPQRRPWNGKDRHSFGLAEKTQSQKHWLVATVRTVLAALIVLTVCGVSFGFGGMEPEVRTRHGFRTGLVLAKYRGGRPRAVPVPSGDERAALRRLWMDPAIEYAELDYVLTRQFAPNDPQYLGQWHHKKLGSTNAWAISVGVGLAGRSPVTIAIMDRPFQMNHPDLQANAAVGWSMVRNAPNPFETNGFYHSTIGAGIAGAIVNNSIGVSGMGNCVLLPVDIGDLPTTSDMYNAVIWAADHGIRVVNLSWDGAFSSLINDAGAYLKEKTRGMLFMAGVNGDERLNYTSRPHIYAVSMTDMNDQSRSCYGNHIDFAAPGWDVYSTTTNSGYKIDSGTSYSAPLMAGVAAWIMSVAPELGPTEIEELLKAGCVDLGTPGWDEHYGWGRIDFGRVAQLTFERTAISRVTPRGPGMVEAVYEPDVTYRLFRSGTLWAGQWEAVPGATLDVTNAKVVLSDPGEETAKMFYKVEITRPR